MFTDMVDYTALGQRNESLSLALVDEQRKLIQYGRPSFWKISGNLGSFLILSQRGV